MRVFQRIRAGEWRRTTWAAAVFATLVAAAAFPAARLAAQSASGDGSVDADGVWTHDTPADIGVEVSEATKGFTYRQSVTVSLAKGSLTVPKATGITWGFGDGPCGYGWTFWLPNGTQVCFNEDAGTVAVHGLQPADKALADELSHAIPAYTLRSEGQP